MNEDILDVELPTGGKVSRFVRLKGLFFDYISICLLFPFLLAPFMGIIWVIEEYTSYGCFLYYLSLFITLVIHKDALNGMSFGKRQAGLQIIDIHTNKKASNFKCVLRNLLIPILHVELFINLFNPERKLSDFIVGTKLSLRPKVSLSETRKEFKACNKKELLKSFVLVFFVVLLLLYLIGLFHPMETTHMSR